MEQYTVTYNTKDAVYPLTVKYRVYYLKKGGNGKFPTCGELLPPENCEDGFLNTDLPAETLKKLAIYEVYDKEVVIDNEYAFPLNSRAYRALHASEGPFLLADNTL